MGAVWRGFVLLFLIGLSTDTANLQTSVYHLLHSELTLYQNRNEKDAPAEYVLV